MIPRSFRLPWLPRLSPPGPATAIRRRPIVTTAPLAKKALPPRPKPPPEDEIEESYLKGSGPGGQKINKTNSAVQLRHTATGIVVKSQATRSRDQNRKHARELLAQKIDELRNGDESRSAIVGRVRQKRAASADKKKRRKYKKLSGQEADEDDLPENHGAGDHASVGEPDEAADRNKPTVTGDPHNSTRP